MGIEVRLQHQHILFTLVIQGGGSRLILYKAERPLGLHGDIGRTQATLALHLHHGVGLQVQPGMPGAACGFAPLAIQRPAHGLVSCSFAAQVLSHQAGKLPHRLIAVKLGFMLCKSLDIKAVD
ncbi:hypothetical protein D3C72_1588210 [compost metagenome]